MEMLEHVSWKIVVCMAENWHHILKVVSCELGNGSLTNIYISKSNNLLFSLEPFLEKKNISIQLYRILQKTQGDCHAGPSLKIKDFMDTKIFL